MDGEVCGRNGCTGVIEDGYCNVCGLADPKAAPSSAAPASQRSVTSAGTSAGSATGSGSSRRGKTNTGSTPSGRARSGSRRTSKSSSRSTRSQLGAGLIQLPELPSAEPEKAILSDPKVPENKRFCSNCEAQLSRERGFCGKCGRKYNFVPSLRPGDVIAGQYQVKGAMAYGGLGWIYLGFDQTLTRYVVLKGLLNAEDEASAAVAVAERKFLAAVKHPNIVGIYNFVKHGSEGFIVMEYVGGKTLKQIRKERGPLPVAEAIAYIHRILGAFAYLHSLGLVYCDFKPDNMMLESNDVKLIDMGGVRRIDDTGGDIYGTIGYSAPEAGEGPTAISDLFTIGRTLAVLVTDIKSFTKDHRYSLPDAAEDAVFSKQESFYRALLKATAENPDDRFQSADEMADQLLGVMREVVAVETGAPRPASSNLFGPDVLALEHEGSLDPIVPGYEHLPMPLLDQTDAAMRALVNASAIADPPRRVLALRAVGQQWPNSLDAQFRLAGALTDAARRGPAGAIQEAAKILDDLATKDAWDWRVPWYRGRMLLAQAVGKDYAARAKEAQAQFDQVYFDLPGEIAPKLAMGLAAEIASDLPVAAAMYDLVAKTDPSYLTAVFGQARVLAAIGDRQAAVSALTRVPETSSMFLRSQVEVARSLIRQRKEASGAVSVPGVHELVQAGTALEQLNLDVMDRLRLSYQILETAFGLLLNAKLVANPGVSVLGYKLDEFNLRLGLEKYLREMARLESDHEKIRLVDEANQIRPRTLF